MVFKQGSNFAWAGLVLGSVTVVLSPFEIIALLIGVPLTLALLLAWAWSNGWRLRSPFYRPHQRKERTKKQEEAIAETRKVRDAFTELLHARGRPAVSRLVRVFEGLVGKLEKKEMPARTVALLVSMYPRGQVEHAEAKIRRVLEGPFWDDPEAKDLNRFARERDLEKQSAFLIGVDFYLYFADYAMLITWTRHVAFLLDIDAATDPRFAEWRRLHEQFVGRLRDVLALPGIRESVRSDFMTRIDTIDDAK